MPNYSEWQRRALAAEARCQVLVAEIEGWRRGSDYLGAEVLRLRGLINGGGSVQSGLINGDSLDLINGDSLVQQCNCPMCEAQGPTSEGRSHA